MLRSAWFGALLLLTLAPSPAGAWWRPAKLNHLNRRLAGHVVDYTNNHGVDRRLWSPTLQMKRELYVYLPPGYDPCKRYPVLLWLHGINQDEESFVFEGGLEKFDAAIACGRLPPMIIAVPDGSARGRLTPFAPNTLFLNSAAGDFEDYVTHDVWDFLVRHYPIRPERGAHVVGGYSGGGGAAYRVAIKYRPEFGTVFGLLPPVNIRWMDCHGDYFAPFDPNCWGWRENVDRGREVVGRFYGGIVVVRVRQLVYPLFGRGPEAVSQLSRENPIELLDLYPVRPGELAMYIGHGGRDQFNLKAQVDSFLFRCGQLGLPVAVGYDPKGKHDWGTAERLLPGLFPWLSVQLAPYCGKE
jgi:S-formylglutathione hydrolase FrmB